VRHLRGWGGLRGEDFRQSVDVNFVEDALPSRLLKPGDELSAQDVDPRMEQATLIGDLLLLTSQVVDELFEIVVGQVREVRKRFQRAAFLVEGWSQ
jgi:hypothetical protein